MATTIKEKGSASSSSVTEKMRKNTSSPNPQAKKTATKPSSDQKPEKPLPNYLKPTISSSLDFSASRTLRRSTTDISTKATKPAATIRRHPLEKPPLPAQTHKAQPAKHAPQRSVSSLSSKPTKTGAGPSIRRSLSAKGGSSSSNGDPKKAVAKTGSKKDALDHTVGSEDDVAHSVLETPAHGEVIEKAEEEDEEAQHENEELGVVIEEEESIEKEGFESEDHADQEKGMEEFKEDKDEAEEKSESAAKQTESGPDYNDVIEETATKLMEEDNKNKVRALAGAFETVISLQDTK